MELAIFMIKRGAAGGMAAVVPETGQGGTDWLSQNLRARWAPSPSISVVINPIPPNRSALPTRAPPPPIS